MEPGGKQRAGRGRKRTALPGRLVRSKAGFSADYVFRETRRAVAGVQGTACAIWPGIDIDIPTAPEHSKCTRQGVKEAVLAAFRGGGTGVILSRKYSEMRLENLSGAGDAVAEWETQSSRGA